MVCDVSEHVLFRGRICEVAEAKEALEQALTPEEYASLMENKKL